MYIRAAAGVTAAESDRRNFTSNFARHEKFARNIYESLADEQASGRRETGEERKWARIFAQLNYPRFLIPRKESRRMRARIAPRPAEPIAPTGPRLVKNRSNL